MKWWTEAIEELTRNLGAFQIVAPAQSRWRSGDHQRQVRPCWSLTNSDNLKYTPQPILLKLLYFCAMSEEEVKTILLKINWDTPLHADELYRIFTGAEDHIGGIDKEWIYVRILNTFKWYTVLSILPKSELPHLLSDKIINRLFPRQLRNKYRHVRSALFE